jgi:hypothetical protein
MRHTLHPLPEIILSNNHEIKEREEGSELFPSNLLLVLFDLFKLTLPRLAYSIPINHAFPLNIIH